jgi:hypothetical protein
MAIECMAPIIQARRATWAKADLMVLLMMANYADPDGTNIFPPVAKLARCCRLKERQVQASIKALLNRSDDQTAPATVRARDRKDPNKVLFLVQRANQSGFGGRRTNEYRIDLERVQSLQGCKFCGGVSCNERGCKQPEKPPQNSRGTGAKNRRGRVQKTVRHIDRPVPQPVHDFSAGSPRAPERRGDPAIWERLAAVLEPAILTKLATWEAAPAFDGGRLVVAFPKAFAERFVIKMRRDLQAAMGMPTAFTCAGREVA